MKTNGWLGLAGWLITCAMAFGVRADTATNLTSEGIIQQAGNTAAGLNSVALGTNTMAEGENSLSGGFNAQVQPQHSNAVIFATGSPEAMRQTAYPDTAHFERMILFSQANEDSNSVLARWENDVRYAPASVASDIGGLWYNSAWLQGLIGNAQAAADAAMVAATNAAAWRNGIILTNTIDFGGQAASNVSQIYIGYATQAEVTVSGNGAIQFEGSGYASAASGSWFPAGDKSVFLWVNPQSDGIIFQAGVGSEGGAFRIARGAGVAYLNGGYGGDLWLTNQLPVDTWTFVAATYDSATMITKVYVNGDPPAQNQFAMNTVQTVPVALGAYGYTGGGNISARIGPVGVYSRAVSPEEVAALYNEGAGTLQIPQSGLAAFWPMMDGTGATIHDGSAHGQNMAIIGSATWSSSPFGTSFQYPAMTQTNNFAFVPTNAPLHSGDYLAFDGSSGTRWTSLPADLMHNPAGTNLNMNGFSVTNVQLLHVLGPAEFKGRISIEPQGDIDMGTFQSRP